MTPSILTGGGYDADFTEQRVRVIRHQRASTKAMPRDLL